MTYFVCDMTSPGVEVRPLRQITGEAEFNEVFLTDVRLPDTLRLGEVGEGWRVAQTTLMNERVSIGGGAMPREGGMIGVLADTWRDRPELRTPGGHDAVLRLWVRRRGRPADRRPAAPAARRRRAGPGGIGGQALLRHAQPGASPPRSWTCSARKGSGTTTGRSAGRESVDFLGRTPAYRYLRAKGNSIEGGTSEILRNIIAERVLGLPVEPRADKDVAVEGPAAMTVDLRYYEVEEELRTAVRELLAARSPPSAVLARVETAEPYDPKLWRQLAGEMGLAGLAVPTGSGGAGASWREVAVVLEELGRAVAPVPYLGSAVVATRALQGCGPSGAHLLGRLASGVATAALAVPFGVAPSAPRRARRPPRSPRTAKGSAGRYGRSPTR